MNLQATLDADCDPDVLFSYVDDLADYPAWMPLVHRAEPIADDPDAWAVELRARVGPLARSKRLRMVRTASDRPHSVRFERAEADGRAHSPWVLAVTIDDRTDGRSHLVMDLHYGGGLWTGGALERILADQVDEGRRNLLALVADADR